MIRARNATCCGVEWARTKPSNSSRSAALNTIGSAGQCAMVPSAAQDRSPEDVSATETEHICNSLRANIAPTWRGSHFQRAELDPRHSDFDRLASKLSG